MIDRIGTLTEAENGQISDNLWEGLSQKQASEHLNRLPNKLASPSYRALTRAVLLSDAPEQRDSIIAPALLLKRINLLIQYGLFEDAQALFNKAEAALDLSSNPDAALIPIKIALAEGGAIAAACLDIQALATNFSDNAQWQELSNFCRQRFASDNQETVIYNAYPALGAMISEQPLDFKSLTSLETLIAYADKKLFKESVYNNQARYLGGMSDLHIILGQDNFYQNEETHQCYVIEAAARGLIDADALAKHYVQVPLSQSLIDNNDGLVNMHPCHIPAFFYQKLQDTEAEDENLTDYQAQLVESFLNVTQSLPAYALTPFSDYLNSDKISSTLQWRASIIKGLAGKSIPESYGTQVQPLRQIESQSLIRIEGYREWLDNEINRIFLDENNIDYAAIIKISQILNGEFNNLYGTKYNNDYENTFSLTYAKKSLHLGIGFESFMSRIYQSQADSDILTRLISLTGESGIKPYGLKEMAVILSVFKAYKLENNSVALAFEYLQ
jgi:hypothetical protein